MEFVGSGISGEPNNVVSEVPPSLAVNGELSVFPNQSKAIKLQTAMGVRIELNAYCGGCRCTRIPTAHSQLPT